MMPFLSAVHALTSGSCHTMAIVHSCPRGLWGDSYGRQTYGSSGRDYY